MISRIAGGLPEKYNRREFRLKKIGTEASYSIERLCGTVPGHERTARPEKLQNQ
jgi:hypothetical protein